VAEDFGPDQALAAAAERLRQARMAWSQSRQPEWRIREQLGMPYGPLLPSQGQAVAQQESQAFYDSPQARAAEYAEKQYQRDLEDHPANLYASILEGSQAVRAPRLSGFDKWRLNPSLATAVPRTDEQQDENARLLYVMDRVRDHARRHPSNSPLAIEHYRGAGADYLAEAMVEDSTRQQNPAVQGFLESPYTYIPPGYGPDLEPLPPERLLTDTLNRAVSAPWGAAGRFHDNIIGGASAFAEGRGAEALKSAAYALPNLASPVFHRHGPGMEGDWRERMEPGEAAAIDTAAELPWWFFRGIAGRSPGRSLAGVENRIRGHRDELLSLRGRAAQRHHPDIGGAADDMRRVNAAFEAGDMQTLLRMAR